MGSDIPVQRPVVALGEFDGFHLGHRQLMHVAAATARRRKAPLAAVVLDDSSAPDQLSAVTERCRSLMAAGAPNAQVITLSAPDDEGVPAMLMDQLIRRIDPCAVVMANLPESEVTARYPSLRAEFERRGVDLIEVPRWTDPDGRIITTSAIRGALAAGDIAKANDWLGRPFTLRARVVHGSGLGRTIGFPTANLGLAANRMVPMNGVYAAVVELADGTSHSSAVNIGVRPTVERDGTRLVEAHLLDFDGDLYETVISVRFRRWLRDERRFATVDQLIERLQADVEQTRLVLRP